jgi:hypothetical protein
MHYVLFCGPKRRQSLTIEALNLALGNTTSTTFRYKCWYSSLQKIEADPGTSRNQLFNRARSAIYDGTDGLWVEDPLAVKGHLRQLLNWLRAYAHSLLGVFGRFMSLSLCRLYRTFVWAPTLRVIGIIDSNLIKAWALMLIFPCASFQQIFLNRCQLVQFILVWLVGLRCLEALSWECVTLLSELGKRGLHLLVSCQMSLEFHILLPEQICLMDRLT